LRIPTKEECIPIDPIRRNNKEIWLVKKQFIRLKGLHPPAKMFCQLKRALSFYEQKTMVIQSILKSALPYPANMILKVYVSIPQLIRY
jgi:hypothetical protein